MDFLRVFSSEHIKSRVGSDNDGGYVIAHLPKTTYDSFLSCGISNDISFEDAFTDLYKINCYAFDGTIERLPHDRNTRIQFIKKNIAKTQTDNTTNMHDLMSGKTNIFLKMDIETNEYQWIQSLTREQLLQFAQMTVEFHFPFTYSEDIFSRFSYPLEVESKLECLRRIADTHYLIHFHANNCCGTTYMNNIEVPNVFECTYIRKDLCENISNNTVPIPDPLLDRKNVSSEHEIHLSGYPFTSL